MRFVTKTVHAWLDYPAALSLITLPFLLGLGASHPLALAISPIVGVAAFLMRCSPTTISASSAC